MGRWIIPYLLNPVFWLIVATALYINHLQNAHIQNFWTSYGMDILAMPVYLYIAQVVMMGYYKSPDYSISHKDRLIIVILIAVVFELILPLFSNRYTADWLDILAYFFGTYAIYPIVVYTPNFLIGLNVYLKKR